MTSSFDGQLNLFEDKTLDKLCKEKIEKCPNVIVAWILMAAYLYYKHNESILSDGLFDDLCKKLMYSYGDITHHHKSLIALGNLSSGSLYDLSETDYPTLVKDAAGRLLYDHFGVDLDGRYAREDALRRYLDRVEGGEG